MNSGTSVLSHVVCSKATSSCRQGMSPNKQNEETVATTRPGATTAATAVATTAATDAKSKNSCCCNPQLVVSYQ